LKKRRRRRKEEKRSKEEKEHELHIQKANQIGQQGRSKNESKEKVISLSL